MRVLLAGATGVIGRRVLPILVEAGHTVFGTTRRPERLHDVAIAGATPLVMDALDDRSVAAAVDRAEPEVVLHQLTHLATLDFAGNARLRIDGTRNLIRSAKASGVQRMIAQSIAWVVAPGAEAAHEDEPMASNATPGVRELEEAVAELPSGVVLRDGALYGPGTWYAADGRFAQQARAGELEPTARVTSFVHADDAARAVVGALEWPAGVYNVVDDEPADAAEWMPDFAAAVGAAAPTIPADLPPGRPISNAKARGAGWAPRRPIWRSALGAE